MPAPMFAFADVGVAQIGQVVRLGAGAEARLLQLHEIADVRAVVDVVLHAQPREGPDMRAALQRGTSR